MTKGRRVLSENLFDIFIYIIFSSILLVILYPLYFIVIASISSPSEVMNGNVIFSVKGFQIDGYQRILSSSRIWRAYANTLFYAFLGTSLNVFLTMLMAYPLSNKNFSGRRLIMIMLIFTMYFSGGLIPTFMVINRIGLVGKWPVMVLIGAVAAWNIIIARTVIASSIPEELYHSSKIDGCDEFRYLFKIVFPLSKPLLAVLSLYYGLRHWNSYFFALIYLRNPDHYPLQIILREILALSRIDQDMTSDVLDIIKQMEIAESIKYGIIIIASLPLLLLYPFLQKYFVKGVMVGSIKG